MIFLNNLYQVFIIFILYLYLVMLTFNIITRHNKKAPYEVPY